MGDLAIQLSEQKRKVDFKTFDFSVKEIISMVNEGIINIAPDFQRKFRWDPVRQSQLIESIYLGIPIPSLFMATSSNNRWEVIDGVQRINTIIHYAAELESAARKKSNLPQKLKIESLDKLTELNGKTIDDVPFDLRLDFLLKPLKIITLSDKSDVNVRFDLFQRLNTGGIALSDQEIRNCVYSGNFSKFIKRLSKDHRLLTLTMKPKSADADGTYEELVLRFFAYLYGRDLFVHNVKDFLNSFMEKATEEYNEREYEDIFNAVFDELSQLKHGIIKNVNRKNTSTVFWEAVTVGAAEALKDGVNHLNVDGFYEWVMDQDFNRMITGATNSRQMIDNRVNYCKDKFARGNV